MKLFSKLKSLKSWLKQQLAQPPKLKPQRSVPLQYARYDCMSTGNSYPAMICARPHGVIVIVILSRRCGVPEPGAN